MMEPTVEDELFHYGQPLKVIRKQIALVEQIEKEREAMRILRKYLTQDVKDNINDSIDKQEAVLTTRLKAMCSVYASH